MSVWIDVNYRKPPLEEDVLILYKQIDDELMEENLFYGIAHLFKTSLFGNKEYETIKWSYFTAYQGLYEVCYWTPLVDMPRITGRVMP